MIERFIQFNRKEAISSHPSTEKFPSIADLEAELLRFEKSERQRLGIEEIFSHWRDGNPQRFTKDEKEHTTLLFGGLTYAQDVLIRSALLGLGYKVENLEVPDYESLRFGKEFGNRGQCNPTYFTVGNLIKHLCHLRDKGLQPSDIIRDYIFLTAGACGPCRFGTYVTEYRKALRDAGFEGFRVMLFQQQGGLQQATGEASGLEFTPRFFIQLIKAIMAGDVLNAIGYRIRPYEKVAGSTQEALTTARTLLAKTLEQRGSVYLTLRKCRKLMEAVEVDRLVAKPKVTIIGEFWAMTTEGDGNYKLQQFLEAEGAEVEVQLVTAWLLYNIWEHTHDTRRRMDLREYDAGKFGLKDTDPVKKLRMLALAERILTRWFKAYSNAMGLYDYHLPDMMEIATISHQYYNNELRGGEGHMEVGKLIQTVEKKKAHMVVSVKPFGCMPSSSISDGVQSLVTSRFPEAIFCAVETTGDAAVNVYSRVQMMLFKARLQAKEEFDSAVASSGLTLELLRSRIARSRKLRSSLHAPAHYHVGTGANILKEALG